MSDLDPPRAQKELSTKGHKGPRRNTKKDQKNLLQISSGSGISYREELCPPGNAGVPPAPCPARPRPSPPPGSTRNCAVGLFGPCHCSSRQRARSLSANSRPRSATSSQEQGCGRDARAPGGGPLWAARAGSNFARGSTVCLRASAPQFRKTSFKKRKYHSPLEGESQKPSRMAKASAVGGAHKQRPMARSCAPSRVRTGQATGEGRSGGGPTPAMVGCDILPLRGKLLLPLRCYLRFRATIR